MLKTLELVLLNIGNSCQKINELDELVNQAEAYKFREMGSEIPTTFRSISDLSRLTYNSTKNYSDIKLYDIHNYSPQKPERQEIILREDILTAI